VIEELNATGWEVPIAFEDLAGSLPGSGGLIWDVIGALGPIPPKALNTLKAKSAANQLILSYHFYETILTHGTDFQEMVGTVAKQQAKVYTEDPAGIPTWLSEYFEGDPVKCAELLLEAEKLGANAVTYWHYENLFLPPDLFVGSGGVNQTLWPGYVERVRNGTTFGAQINGAGGGDPSVLDVAKILWGFVVWFR